MSDYPEQPCNRRDCGGPEHWLRDGEPSGPDNEWPGDPENIPSRLREAGREFRERVR